MFLEFVQILSILSYINTNENFIKRIEDTAVKDPLHFK